MALHRFGLVAPELNRICEDVLSLNDNSTFSITLHYQLTGSMNLRIICIVNKLCVMMEILDVTLTDSQSVYNLAESDMVNHEAVGTLTCKTFVEEHVTGGKSISERMKQKKLLTFKSSARTLKLHGKVKEDRTLMHRILVISHKTPGD